MSRKAGLFGGRPSVLLVDDRPRGIDLQSLQTAPLPALQDEPEVDIIDEADEADGDDDSYDGGGPLRIFIGSPTRAAGAPPPAVPSLPTPIWDASALASSTFDEEPASAEPAASKARPILRKPGAIEPPPLAMSFGRSFSRGSLDAGVMDDGLTSIDSDIQRDSVVVHQQIYDRLLRFDDPVDRAGLGAFDPGESDDEPLSVGASDEDELSSPSDAPVAPAFLTEAPPARTVEFQFTDPYEPEPAPVPAPAPVPDSDEIDLPWSDEEDPDALATGDISGSLDSLTQPLDAVDPPARVVFGAAPPPAPIVVHDSPPTVPPTVFSPIPPTPAPDWSAQRREAQARAPAQALPEEEAEGGISMGLVILVLVVVGLLAGGWYLLRSDGDPAPAPAPVAPVRAAPSEVLPPQPDEPPVPDE